MDINELPIVAILDAGVEFVSPFDQLVIDHWKAPNSAGGDGDHGTRVASKAAFAHNLYGRGISAVSDSKFSSPSRVTFVRTGTLNKTTKERVKIYMPEILAAQMGRNIAKVTVTCLSQPPVDRTKGSEYLGAYIRASLKKSHPDGHLIPVSQDYSEGRKKWDVCHQFSKMFSSLNAGDWQIWLEMFSRWDEDQIDVPYALVATIEDVSETLDVYNEVQTQNRYQAVNTLRLKIDT